MIGSNRTISVYKLTASGSTNVFPGSPAVSSADAFIESQRGELTQVLNLESNIEVYMMYTDPINIDVSDKIVDSAGVEYRVAGIEKHEGNSDTDDLYVTTLHKKRV